MNAPVWNVMDITDFVIFLIVERIYYRNINVLIPLFTSCTCLTRSSQVQSFMDPISSSYTVNGDVFLENDRRLRQSLKNTYLNSHALEMIKVASKCNGEQR